MLVAPDTASLQRAGGRFSKVAAIVLRKPAEVSKAKSCCKFCYRGRVRAIEQERTSSCQAQLSPIFERRNSHESPKMLAKRSLGNTAVNNQVRNRHLPVRMTADVVDRLFEVARKWTLAHRRVRTGRTGASLLTNSSAKHHERLLRKFLPSPVRSPKLGPYINTNWAVRGYSGRTRIAGECPSRRC